MKPASFFIAVLCVFAWGPYAVNAGPKSAADKKAILAAICQKGQIRKGMCRRARDYPEGRSCDIGLTGEGGEGRFLVGDDTSYLVAAYTSGCEPHANNWGGSLIFERGKRRKLAFLVYQPGMAVKDCLTMARADGGNRLVCAAGWMGQGYQTEMIGEVVLKKDTDGKVTAGLEERISASRSEDARGANSVECGKPVMFFGFGKLMPGPSPESIMVQTDYAPEPLIRMLCAKPDRNAVLGTEPPLDNEAYIAKKQELKGWWIYDLAKRELLPAEKTPAPQR